MLCGEVLRNIRRNPGALDRGIAAVIEATTDQMWLDVIDRRAKASAVSAIASDRHRGGFPRLVSPDNPNTVGEMDGAQVKQHQQDGSAVRDGGTMLPWVGDALCGRQAFARVSVELRWH